LSTTFLSFSSESSEKPHLKKAGKNWAVINQIVPAKLFSGLIAFSLPKIPF